MCEHGVRWATWRCGTFGLLKDEYSEMPCLQCLPAVSTASEGVGSEGLVTSCTTPWSLEYHAHTHTHTHTKTEGEPGTISHVNVNRVMLEL